MDILLTTAALALPVLLGGLWLNLVVPANCVARPAVVWGNGTMIGLILLPQLMRSIDALGVPLDFALTGYCIALLIAPALLLQLTRGRPPGGTARQQPSSLGTAQKILVLVLLLCIALRIVTLGLEVLWRPLFPWDATMHWATKARVWFEYKSVVPFVSNGEWLRLGGEEVFTDRHPAYPGMIPLLQVWMNLALHRWDESLMNLPWLLCFIAMGAAFFGQLRSAGVTTPIAMAFTYLLISMPLVDTHVALAGYADLFLGASYCAALMAFHNWTVSRQRWQGMLALFFAIACALIKDEGSIWLMTLVPAVAVVFMARREAAKLFLLLCLTVILLWLVLPRDFQIVGHSLAELAPTFNPGAPSGVIQSVFLHDSWHLFGYLIPALIVLALFLPGVLTRTYLAVSVALASAVAAFLFLFLFTGFGWGAANFTAVGRLSIQLAPGLAFLGGLIFNELIARDGLKA